MAMRGFTRGLGTLAVVAAGAGAIAVDQVVSERGPDVIIDPAMAALERLKPIGAAASETLSDLIGVETGPEIVPPPETAALAAETAETGIAAAPEARASAPARAEPADALLAARCDAEGALTDVAVLGDRLALRFFERSALAVRGGSDAASSNSIVFERLDLSGSYEVGSDGAISLPAIGHVDVIARSLPCIEQSVSIAARERLHLDASISAAFASRPPVLIRGSVRAPGAHAYLPGLTVERVLAQAGAIEPVRQVSAQQVASLRARETELGTREAGLLIELARVDAALAEDPDFIADRDARALVARTLGEGRVRTEHEKLLSELAEEDVQKARTRDQIADLTRRVGASRDHLAVVEEQLSHVIERHENLEALLRKGLVAEGKMEEARLRRMTMERTVLERRDTLLQLESELKLARHGSDLRRAQRRMHLASKARDIAAERSLLQDQLRSVRAQLDLGQSDAPSVFTVMIQRPRLDGTSRFAASPETSVRPGDLLTVALADADSVETPIAVPAPEADAVAPALPVVWIRPARDGG